MPKDALNSVIMPSDDDKKKNRKSKQEEKKQLNETNKSQEKAVDTNKKTNASLQKQTKIVVEHTKALKEEEKAVNRMLTAEEEYLRLLKKLTEEKKKETDELVSSSKKAIDAILDQKDKELQVLDELQKRRKAALKSKEDLGNNFSELINGKSLTGKIKGNALKEVKDDLYGLQSTLGKNLVGWTALAAGTIFASKKIKEYIDDTKDAAVSFAKFRQSQSALSNVSLLPGGSEQLEKVRTSLGQTRDEFFSFQKVFSDASSAGVKNLNDLFQASLKLKDQFGGEQNERLKEYVELLKEIPTLNEDLKITATTDDKTAAIFALASQGKVGTTIDLQSAGLLGGLAKDKKPQESNDVKLLNAAQESAAATEDIRAGLYQTFFPNIGPWIGAIIGGLTAVAATGISAIALYQTGNVLARGIFKNSSDELSKEDEIIQCEKELASKISESNKRLDNIDSHLKAGLEGVERAVRGQSGILPQNAKKSPLKNPQAQNLAVTGLQQAKDKVIKADKLVLTGSSAIPTLFNSLPALGKVAAGGATGAEAATAVSGVSGALGSAGATAAKFAGPVAIIAGIKIAGNFLEDQLESAGKSLKDYGKNLKETGQTQKNNPSQFGSAQGSENILAGSAVGIVGSLVDSIGKSIGNVLTPLGFGSITKDFIDTTKSIGAELTVFGDELNSQTKEGQSRYNGLFQAVGYVTSGFGSLISGLGSVTSYLASGFLSTISDVAGGISNGIGSVIEFITLSGDGADELKRDRAEKIKSGKQQAIALRNQKALNAVLKDSLEAQQASALSLQRFIANIEQASKTAKVQLYEFKQALAESQIGILSEIGGNLKDFSTALDDASSSIIGKFNVIAKGLDEVKKNILLDKNLDSATRQVALNKAKFAEIEAIRKLNDSLLGLVGRFNEVPEIIKAELKNRLSDVKLGVGAKAGNLSSENIGSELLSQFRESLNAFSAANEVGNKDAQTIGSLGKSISSTIETSQNTIANSIKGLNESDFSGESLQTLKQIKELSAQNNKEGLNSILSKLEDSIKNGLNASELDRQIVGMAESINELYPAIADQTRKVKSEEAKQTEALKNLKSKEATSLDANTKVSQKQNNSLSFYTSLEALQAEAATAAQDEEKATAELEDASAKAGAEQKKLKELQDKKIEIQKNLVEISKTETNLAAIRFDGDRELLARVQKGSATQADLETFSTIVAAQSAKRNNTSEKELKQQQQLASVLGKVSSVSDTSVALIRGTTKSLTGVLVNLESTLDILDRLSEITERSAGVLDSQRQLSIIEAQRGFNISIGNSYEANIKSIDGQLSLLDAQSSGLKTQRATLREMESLLSDVDGFYVNQNRTLSNTVKNAKGSKDKLNLNEFGSVVTDNDNVNKVLGNERGSNVSVKLDEFYEKILNDIEKTTNERASEIDAINKSGLSSTDKNAGIQKISESKADKFRDLSKGIEFIEKVVNENASSGRAADISANLKAVGQKVFINGISGLSEITKKAVIESDKARKSTEEIKSNIFNIVDSLSNALADIPNELSIKSFSEQFDSAGLKSEVAGARLNFSELGKFTTEQIQAGAQEYNETIKKAREALKPENVDKAFNKIVAQIDSQIGDIKSKGNLSNGDREELSKLELAKKVTLESGKTFIVAKQESVLANAELKFKQKTLEAAEKERNIKEDLLESERSVLETTASFLSETGGSVGQIIDIQQKIIGLKAESLEALKAEKLRIDAAQQAAEAAGDQAQASVLAKESVKKQNEITKSTINLQRDAIGAQRDAYEKLISSAFGSIRGSVGARKNVLSDASTFGQNRVKLASGLNVSGGSKTIESRQVGLANAVNNSGGILANPSRNPLEGALSSAIQNGIGGGSSLGGIQSLNTPNAPLVSPSLQNQNNRITNDSAQKVDVKVKIDINLNTDMFTAAIREIVTKDPAIQNDLGRTFVRA